MNGLSGSLLSCKTAISLKMCSGGLVGKFISSVFSFNFKTLIWTIIFKCVGLMNCSPDNFFLWNWIEYVAFL